MLDQAHADRDPHVREDALRWFADDLTDAFGVRYVCDHLGLDLADVRGRLDQLAGAPR